MATAVAGTTIVPMAEPLYGTPQPSHAPLGPLSAPLSRATSAAQPDADTLRELGTGQRRGEFYQRISHPNALAFEQLVARLEGAEGAVSFASGMAAVAGVMLALLKAGDRVLVAEEIYGGTGNLVTADLPRFGIRVDRFRALEPATLDAALRQPAQMVVFESPVNPTLRLVDVARVAAATRAAGAVSMLDGTFAPPPIQHALRLGVDLVVHSATKFLGGHSDVLAGVVAGSHRHLLPIEAFRRRTGSILAPDPAWLLCRSWPTLELRIAAQQAAALEVARGLHEDWRAGRIDGVSHPGLPDHPDAALARVQMPGGGGTMVSFVVKGGLVRSRAVFDRFRVIARGPSLGSVESLASLPAYTTHAAWTPEQRAAAGIPEGLIRISVGLEGAAVVLEDIRQALQGA